MNDLILAGTDPACLSPSQGEALLPWQVAALLPEQIAALRPEQVAALLPLLGDVPRLERPYSQVLEATNGCTASFDMLNWHNWHNACRTTHCAAGWIVTLAGAAGAALELRCGTPAAARLILLKSCPADWPLPNFYASNEAAAAFISHMAERERTGL